MQSALTFEAVRGSGESLYRSRWNEASASKAQAEIFRWSCAGRAVNVACDCVGVGPRVLCLPSMGRDSTRREWQAVAAALAEEFAFTLVDWPGFGDSARLHADYSPAFFDAFLRDFVRARFGGPVAVLATGHAAGYVLRSSLTDEALWSCAILAMPAWQATPGEPWQANKTLRTLMGAPVLREVLHRLNPARHSPDRTEEREYTGSAEAALVHGALDPFADFDSCFKALKCARFPSLIVAGDAMPAESVVRMKALAKARPRAPLILDGPFSRHEECRKAFIAPVREFLNLHVPEAISRAWPELAGMNSAA